MERGSPGVIPSSRQALARRKLVGGAACSPDAGKPVIGSIELQPSTGGNAVVSFEDARKIRFIDVPELRDNHLDRPAALQATHSLRQPARVPILTDRHPVAAFENEAQSTLIELGDPLELRERRTHAQMRA